ncbi:MAG: 7-cyano-7-deazaguanine synthase [Nitrososphaerales archaeon]
MSSSKSAVVIVSGGLDSSGVASYWKKEGYVLRLMTFDYGQRARPEIKRALELGKELGAEVHKVIDISFMKELYGTTNVLTDETAEMPSRFQSNIIVPLRNGVFLTIAAAYAFSTKAEVLAYGAHLSDLSYPDCRPEFAKLLGSALNLGDIDAIDAKAHPAIRLWSPATEGLTKDQMLKISHAVQGNLVYRTWSCYLDGEKQCGRCESCNNRKKAFQVAGIPDLTEYFQ